MCICSDALVPCVLIGTPSWVELIFLQCCIYISLRTKGDYTPSDGLAVFFSPESGTVKDVEAQECWVFFPGFLAHPFALVLLVTGRVCTPQ